MVPPYLSFRYVVSSVLFHSDVCYEWEEGRYKYGRYYVMWCRGCEERNTVSGLRDNLKPIGANELIGTKGHRFSKHTPSASCRTLLIGTSVLL